MKNQKFSIVARIKSFKYAFNGLFIFFRDEHNARIHSFAAIVAISLGFVFKISALEWLAISLSIALVFALELINTSIENLADFISPEKNDSIKKVKDLAAGAVLVTAIGAAVVGVVVFLPKVLELVKRIAIS